MTLPVAVNPHGQSDPRMEGWKLNPAWTEIHMNFPLGWTDLSHEPLRASAPSPAPGPRIRVNLNSPMNRRASRAATQASPTASENSATPSCPPSPK